MYCCLTCNQGMLTTSLWTGVAQNVLQAYLMEKTQLLQRGKSQMVESRPENLGFNAKDVLTESHCTMFMMKKSTPRKHSVLSAWEKQILPDKVEKPRSNRHLLTAPKFILQYLTKSHKDWLYLLGEVSHEYGFAGNTGQCSQGVWPTEFGWY